MVERLYPAVFVSEIPFEARPIDGVSTSNALAAGIPERSARLPGERAPEWTDPNQHDPGLTLLQLLAWSLDSLGVGASLDHSKPLRNAVPSAHGVVAGLAIGTEDGAKVSISPSVAIGPDGRPPECDAKIASSREPKP